MNIVIRKAVPEDLPAIKAGLIDSWTEHARKEPDLLDEEDMRNVNVESYYKDAFESDESIILVAEDGNNFAGIIRADISEIPHFYKHNKILYLDDVYVSPKYRGHGIVGKLISEVETFAKERGINRIQARVYTYNSAMQKALTRAGYHAPHSTWDKVIQ